MKRVITILFSLLAFSSYGQIEVNYFPAKAPTVSTPTPPTGGGASGDTLHYSTFTAANNTAIEALTPEVGYVWQPLIGTAKVTSNAMVYNTGASYTKYSVAVDDIDYTIDANIGATGFSYTAQLLVRYTDDNNHIVIDISPSNITIAKLVNGNFNYVGGSVSATFANSLLSVRLRKDSIIIKKDGVEVLTRIIPLSVMGQQIQMLIWPGTEVEDFLVKAIGPEEFSSPVNLAAFWNASYYKPLTAVRQTVFVEQSAIEKTAIGNGTDELDAGVLYKGSGSTPTKGYVTSKYQISTSGDASYYWPLASTTLTGSFKGMTIDVSSLATSGSPTKNIIGGIFAKDATHFHGFGYNTVTGKAHSITKNGGSITETEINMLGSISGSITKIHIGMGPANFYLWVVDNTGDTAYGYQAPKVYDYQLEGEQTAGIDVGIFIDTDGTTGTYRFNNVTYGTFGTTGHANPRIVTYEDGEPYIYSGKVYFTQNCVMGGTTDPGNSSCWKDYANGVFTFDLTTHTIARVGTYTFKRPLPITGSTQTFTTDGVSQIIYDRDSSFFITVAQDMTDEGRNTFVCKTTDNILSGTHVLEMLSYIPRPGGVSTQYDPAIVKVIGAYKITLNKVIDDPGELYDIGQQTMFTSSDLTTFTQVWTDNSTTFHEGTTIARVDGTLLSLAPEVAGDQVRILKLSDGSFVAEPLHPRQSNFATGHFAIFPYSHDGITEFILLTHSGSTTDVRWGFNDFGEFRSYLLKPILTHEEYP